MKRPSVTVAISALNEERNIAKFIGSVLKQKQDTYYLEKILIISDGSTDKTVSIARSFKSKKLEVKAFPIREGKSYRLNQIYQDLSSDILFQSDADVVLAAPNVISALIQPLISDKRVGMSGGRALPYKPVTFMEKAIGLTRETYIPLKETLRGGDNKLTVNGRILAYRKQLVKKIRIPAEVIGNDAFTYFSCLTAGYKYKYVASAVVRFRSPKSLADHIKQNTRFVAVRSRMAKYFPIELVRSEFHVPWYLLAYHMAKKFIRHPVLATFIFLVNRYCQIKAVRMEKKLTGKWEISTSTKSYV